MFILPIFGMLLSRYIFNKYHIINEAKYEEIIKELEVRRNLENA
jgi:Na+/melibiose symporter-like transporter